MTSMARPAARLGAVVILIAGGIMAYRLAAKPTVEIADPSRVLSAVSAEDGGTEPVALPAGPILKNNAQEPSRVAVDFGYKVGSVAYAYRLAFDFAPQAEQGTMDLGVPRGQAQAVDQFPAVRRWSDIRKAYLVAVSHDLSKQLPAAPSLCVKAVLGPSKVVFDLSQASLCVMQRDEDGRCHPSTLACGLIR